MLDRTEQRIVGVLMEKELSVPDSYPMTENALLAGCNQKSNRDPEMALEAFEISGALLALRERRWVSRIEGGRASRYRHHADERLRLDRRGMALMAELLLRGPQAPAELSRRLSRMGVHDGPEQVEALLRDLAQRDPPLVEHLALRPRERERRWRHRVGSDEAAPAATPPPAAAPHMMSPPVESERRAEAGLSARVAELERRLDELSAVVERLQGQQQGDLP